MSLRDGSTCPICSSSAEFDDRRGRDSETVRCTRCGPFEISGTALAMLDSRLNEEPYAAARLSHAIRIRTSEKTPVLIASTNLDEFVNQPLPGVEKQLHNLAAWVAAELADDSLGQIPTPWPNTLSGIVGAVNGKRVERLLRYGKECGVLEFNDNEALVGLSPEGWKMVKPAKDATAVATQSSSAPSTNNIMAAHCNRCGGRRDSYNRASHSSNDTDGEVSWSHTYHVLECCGCHNISVMHVHWFSEWDQIEGDPLTGEPRMVPGQKVTIWPPPTKRQKPKWIERLEDQALRDVIEETYQAMSSGMIILAAIGTRTLLDRAMTLCTGEKRLTFKQRIDLLIEEGYIGVTEGDILSVIVDAGNAAAHRAYSPTYEDLEMIVATVENFLERQFVLRPGARSVQESTPQRPPASG